MHLIQKKNRFFGVGEGGGGARYVRPKTTINEHPPVLEVANRSRIRCSSFGPAAIIPSAFLSLFFKKSYNYQLI